MEAFRSEGSQWEFITIAAFCPASDHYFRFEKRNLWIESRLNQEGTDKSAEDCPVFASYKIDHLCRKEKLKKVDNTLHTYFIVTSLKGLFSNNDYITLFIITNCKT